MLWLAKRIGVAILTIWLAASIVFLALHLSAGEHAPAAGEHALVALYLDDFARLLSGDLGVSLRDGAAVTDLVAARLPRTLELLIAALLFAVLLGLPAGLFAALRRVSVLDRSGVAISALCTAVPVFVVGTLLVALADPTGPYVAFEDNPLGNIGQLLLPAFSLAIGLAAAVFRVTRAAVLDVASRDFVRTAIAKGLGTPRILLHHVLRNALIPVVVTLAPLLGALIGGCVLTEYLFAYPGLAGALVDAVKAHDYPEVAGAILVLTTLFIVLRLLLDLLHAVLDPRTRPGTRPA